MNILKKIFDNLVFNYNSENKNVTTKLNNSNNNIVLTGVDIDQTARPVLGLYLRRPNQGSNYYLRLRNIGKDNAYDVNIFNEHHIKYSLIDDSVGHIKMDVAENNLIPNQEINIRFWAEDSNGKVVITKDDFKERFDYLGFLGENDFLFNVVYKNINKKEYNASFIVKKNHNIESNIL